MTERDLAGLILLLVGIGGLILPTVFRKMDGDESTDPAMDQTILVLSIIGVIVGIFLFFFP